MQASLLSVLVSLAQCVLFVHVSSFDLVERASPTATPISVAPAQNWYASV